MGRRIEINWMDVFRFDPLSPLSPAAGRSAAAASAGTGQVEIDWLEILGSSSSAYRDVCFVSPPSTPRAAAEGPQSPPPAKRARSGYPARAPLGDPDAGRRPQLRSEAPRGGLGRRVGERAPVEIDWGHIFSPSSSSSAYRDVCIVSPHWAPRAVAEGLRSPPPKRARAGGPARAPSDDSDGGRRLHRRLQARRGGDRTQVEERAIRSVTRAAAKAAAAGGLDARSAAENGVDFDGEYEREDQNATCKYCFKSSPILVRNHGQPGDDGERGAPAAKNDKEGAHPEEIFKALRGIPGLARDNLLRAYSMLIRDDRLFRSLMALPKNMRKDWLLMEIGNQ